MYTDRFQRTHKFWRETWIVWEYHFTRGDHLTVDVVYCLVIWYPGVPYYGGYQITVTPVFTPCRHGIGDLYPDNQLRKGESPDELPWNGGFQTFLRRNLGIRNPLTNGFEKVNVFTVWRASLSLGQSCHNTTKRSSSLLCDKPRKAWVEAIVFVNGGRPGAIQQYSTLRYYPPHWLNFSLTLVSGLRLNDCLHCVTSHGKPGSKLLCLWTSKKHSSLAITLAAPRCPLEINQGSPHALWISL